MENNKKIVIKKILSKEFVDADNSGFEDDNLDNKIDDKFFEPINEENIDKNLKEIKNNTISYENIKDKLSDEELERASITLAKRIFELAQIKREIRDSVYLNAFNVILESYRISDQFRILNLANQYFLDEYQEYIENRGERPEILSQIMRRVGKANESKYRHIVYGVNLEKLGKNIFDILNDTDGFKQERIKNLLYGNSLVEIDSIRSKVNILFIDIVCQKLSEYVAQYKQVNQKSEDILFEIFADKEEYKKYFYTYASPEERVIYTLIGREREEVNLIEERYNRLKKKDNAFKTDLKIVLSKEQDIMNSLLEGLNYEKIAEKIKDILYPTNQKDLGKEIQYPGIYHSIFFPVAFDQVNLLKDVKNHRERELFCREKILQKFSYLKGLKAERINQALEKAYNFSLSKDIFPELFSFDAEKIAFEAYNALFLRLEPFKIIEMFRFYDFEQTREIKTAYLINFNKNLEEDILDYTRKALKNRFDDNLKNAYSEILLGLQRLDSKFDLINFLLKDKKDFNIWHPEYKVSKESTNDAYKIAEIINNETLSYTDIENHLIDFLSSFDHNTLTEIKHVFYDLLDPKDSLGNIILNIFGNKSSEKIDFVLNNLKNTDNDLIKVLIPHTPLYVQNYILEKDLATLQTELKTKDESKTSIEDLLDSTNMFSSYLVRQLYTYLLRHDDATAFVDSALNLDYKYLKATEFLFNIKYTSLRRLLKELNVKGILSNDSLVSAILRLENIPTDTIEKINLTISKKTLRELLKILNTYPENQRTFEDIYEIIASKEIPTPRFKQIIKDSQSKLTDINECILYIDGYYPLELAKKMHKIISKDEDAKKIKNNLTNLFLGKIDPTLIPTDVNWKVEQNYIATLYYKILFHENILASMRNINFSDDDLIEISKIIYSDEVVTKALVLEDMAQDLVIDEQEIKILKEIMPLRQKRFMMMLREFFNNYTKLPKKLEDYVEENEEIKKIFICDE